MPITKYLENNAKNFPNEVALVELNSEVREIRRTTWREYELIESSKTSAYRRELRFLSQERKIL
ncbi:MAG: hypothetical protein IJB99_00455 [Clostridia bacterium]|nr:hypothetical protein [Clostridia bacterium]